MPAPDYPFSNLQFGQVYDAFRQEVRSGAVMQAFKKRVLDRNGIPIPNRFDFGRAQTRVLGPYAIVTSLEGQSPATVYGNGCGELLIIEPPTEIGTVTLFHDTAPPTGAGS